LEETQKSKPILFIQFANYNKQVANCMILEFE